MDTSVYIFMIILEIFIVFTVFALYFYILVRYFIHEIEATGIVGFFKKHLEFYTPLIKLYKLSAFNAKNPNFIQNKIQPQIDYAKATGTHYNPNWNTATYILLASVLGLFFIVCVYFLIFHRAIKSQISMDSVIAIVILNIIFIVSFELLFVFFVYGNTDLVNFSAVMGL